MGGPVCNINKYIDTANIVYMSFLYWESASEPLTANNTAIIWGFYCESSLVCHTYIYFVVTKMWSSVTYINTIWGVQHNFKQSLGILIYSMIVQALRHSIKLHWITEISILFEPFMNIEQISLRICLFDAIKVEVKKCRWKKKKKKNKKIENINFFVGVFCFEQNFFFNFF